MTGLDFTLGALATWRLSTLLVYEAGPYDLLLRLRRRMGTTVVGRALECFYCTSVWVAAPVAVWLSGLHGATLVTWLALSGAACLAERLSPPAQPTPTVVDLGDAERLNEVTR